MTEPSRLTGCGPGRPPGCVPGRAPSSRRSPAQYEAPPLLAGFVVGGAVVAAAVAGVVFPEPEAGLTVVVPDDPHAATPAAMTSPRVTPRIRRPPKDRRSAIGIPFS